MAIVFQAISNHAILNNKEHSLSASSAYSLAASLLITPGYYQSECFVAECRYIDCCVGECPFTECLFAECFFSDCHFNKNYFDECHFTE
jgi:hypothetical protein